MMRLKKLIKEFRFSESERSRITLGPNVRLVPESHLITLVKTGTKFPTTANLFAKTWLTNPQNAKGWLIFFASVVNKKNNLNIQVTDVRYRLSFDGSSELYWDGSTWRPANTNEWNTEAEVSANLSSFSIANQKIQIVMNLSTTDSSLAPEVNELRVLYNSDIEFQEDLVVRSLIPLLEKQLRPISDYVIDPQTNITAVDLNAIENSYDIVDVDSVYNTAVDPNKLKNIASSFNPTTKIVTLSETVSAGEQAFVRFVYRPVVAIDTDQDYTEFDKVPVVLIDDVNRSESSEFAEDDAIFDKATGAGWKLPSPQINDLEIKFKIMTSSAKDLNRLCDEMNSVLRENQQFVSIGLDERYRLWLIEEWNQLTIKSQSGLHSGRLLVKIAKAVFYSRAAVPITGTLKFSISGNVSVTVTP